MYKPATTPYIKEVIIIKNNLRQIKFGTFPTIEKAQETCDRLNKKKKHVEFDNFIAEAVDDE